MLERIPAALFFEWMEYYSVSPFGAERDDLRIAVLDTVVANALSGKKGRSFEVKDFMLCEQLEHRAKPQTPEQIMGVMKALCVNVQNEGAG